MFLSLENCAIWARTSIWCIWHRSHDNSIYHTWVAIIYIWYPVMWYNFHDAVTEIQWWKIYIPEPPVLGFRRRQSQHVRQNSLLSHHLPWHHLSSVAKLRGMIISKLNSLVQDRDLILDAVLLALQCLLGDALDGHQPLSPLLLGQDHLREGSPVTKTHTRGSRSDPSAAIFGCFYRALHILERGGKREKYLLLRCQDWPGFWNILVA